VTPEQRAAAGRSSIALLLGLAALAAAPDADAGGLYHADRGVRPLGRAGAFIAGADDLGAVAYNPAGLFDAGSQFMIDASWVNYTSDYTRRSLVTQSDPNTGLPVSEYEQTFPTVEGTSPFIPIPTIALSIQPHKQWVLAFAVWAPYAAITSYPEEVEGKPPPQRYSLKSLEGSALAVIGVYAAYAPTPELRLGAGVEALVGSFRSTVDFSGCLPDRFFCAPEDPDWDVASELVVSPIIAPSGRFGAIWAFHPDWRAGVAVSLPYFVRAPATIRTRLPRTAVFERATQSGEDADVSFDLPWTLKLGVETRAVEDLRVELGFAYEAWSMHDEIGIDPDGISLDNVAGFPATYYIPEVNFPRNFQDVVSFRLGGEYAFEIADVPLDLRAGAAYETSAVPVEHLTVLTVDSAKVTGAIGASVHIGKARIDATFAHLFAPEVVVDPREARGMQVSPVRANPPPRPNYINGGNYNAHSNIIGLGFSYVLDPAPVDFMPGNAAAAAKTPAKAAEPAKEADPVKDPEAEKPAEEEPG
jgi:long-chain fatty acid transport protein